MTFTDKIKSLYLQMKLYLQLKRADQENVEVEKQVSLFGHMVHVPELKTHLNIQRQPLTKHTHNFPFEYINLFPMLKGLTEIEDPREQLGRGCTHPDIKVDVPVSVIVEAINKLTWEEYEKMEQVRISNEPNGLEIKVPLKTLSGGITWKVTDLKQINESAFSCTLSNVFLDTVNEKLKNTKLGKNLDHRWDEFDRKWTPLEFGHPKINDMTSKEKLERFSVYDETKIAAEIAFIKPDENGNICTIMVLKSQYREHVLETYNKDNLFVGTRAYTNDTMVDGKIWRTPIDIFAIDFISNPEKGQKDETT